MQKHRSFFPYSKFQKDHRLSSREDPQCPLFSRPPSPDCGAEKRRRRVSVFTKLIYVVDHEFVEQNGV